MSKERDPGFRNDPELARGSPNVAEERKLRRPIEILLVEDNPDDAILTREAFHGAVFANRMHVVSDGVEALAFLRKETRFASAPRPDVILLDLHLPRMGGQEFLDKMRTENDFEKIPVCVLTGAASDLEFADVSKINAACFLVKPIDPNEFAKMTKDLKVWNP